MLESKGVHELFRAFVQLVGSQYAVDLAVTGDGAALPWLRRHAEAAALGERIKFVGRLPHGELGAWFNAADVVCLPSHSEGLPNVLLEAMACGTPCVATRVGGIPEAVTEDTGELVNAKDASMLAAALARALGRVWDRDAIARYAAQFSWEANLDAMARLIDSAIASRG